MSSIEPPSTDPPPLQRTKTPPNTTTSPHPIESNNNTFPNANANMSTEAEPFLSSAQEVNAPAGISTTSHPPPSEGTTCEPVLEVNTGTMTGEDAEFMEFTVFPKFPPELRLKVWKHALPGPRVVEIEYCGAEHEWYSPIESQGRPSSLLRANKESREVYLKSYMPLAKLITVTRQPLSAPQLLHGCIHEFFINSTTYFDSSIDILYVGPSSGGFLCLGWRAIERLKDMPWMKHITTLACELEECQVSFEEEGNNPSAISQLSQLKELTIVVCDVNWYSMIQTKIEWSKRSLGELEFVDSSTDLAGVQSFFNDWLEHVPKLERPKLVVKKVLRGGVLPEVLVGFREGRVEEAEDETDSD